MDSDSLVTQIERLPEESRKVLLTLLDLLAKKNENATAPEKRHVFKFDWEGSLSDAFNGATSIDLQHEANKWR
jgi:hypothetical protein